MKLKYTEFSFGYALTENLIRLAHCGHAHAPVFPNLREEARLGYDVHIDLPGFPLFLQFKLPDLMLGKNAMEISSYSLDLNLPFFRMYLQKRNLSGQHEHLIDLEGSCPHSVYYVAPMMKSIEAFDAAYTCARVPYRSVFFSPQDIGPLPDDRQHVVSYRSGLDHAWLCSEPKKISPLSFDGLSRQIRTAFEHPPYRTLEAVARKVGEAMLELLGHRLQLFDNNIREGIRRRRAGLNRQDAAEDSRTKVVEDLLVYRQVALIWLGLELIIAQPPSEQ